MLLPRAARIAVRRQSNLRYMARSRTFRLQLGQHACSAPEIPQDQYVDSGDRVLPHHIQHT